MIHGLVPLSDYLNASLTQPNRRKTDDWNIAQVRYCCLRHGCRAEPWVIVSILLLFLSSFARLKNDERKESNGGHEL